MKKTIIITIIMLCMVLIVTAQISLSKYYEKTTEDSIIKIEYDESRLSEDINIKSFSVSSKDEKKPIDMENMLNELQDSKQDIENQLKTK